MPCHQDFCRVWNGAAHIRDLVYDPNAVKPQQPKEKEVKGSFKMRLGAAIAVWALLALAILLMPNTSHSATPPPDPGLWFKDANVMYMASVERLHETRTVAGRQVKALDGAASMAARTQCLSVSMEYNKRAANIKAGGKPKRQAGKDKDGNFAGYAATEDFFEKRGLPRNLDGRACQT